MKHLIFIHLLTDSNRFSIFKVYVKGISMFLEIEKCLMDLRNRYVGVTLNIQGSNMEFSDIVQMLKEERSQFEVRYDTFNSLFIY